MAQQSRRLLLIRHGEVADSCRVLCYGQSDVALSERGHLQNQALLQRLTQEPITHSFHSGLTRTRCLAEALAEINGLTAVECPELRERTFGTWEMRPWDEIYAETGDAMLGSVRAPDAWRPPDGETTFEMRDRVLTWFNALPPTGLIVAVTHGGPIAALRGTLMGLAVEGWVDLIPACGTVVEFVGCFPAPVDPYFV